MSCCALCQLSIDDEDSLQDIQRAVERTKAESSREWNTRDRESGETAIIVMTTPWERNLIKNLKVLGFKPQTTINSRNGYWPRRKIKMWILAWNPYPDGVCPPNDEELVYPMASAHE